MGKLWFELCSFSSLLTGVMQRSFCCRTYGPRCIDETSTDNIEFKNLLERTDKSCSPTAVVSWTADENTEEGEEAQGDADALHDAAKCPDVRAVDTWRRDLN